MRLTLGPLQYFWPRERVLAFYREAADWPLDVIYLGENVCSKRRELATRDWIALAHELADDGLEVVLSSLALLEAESELASLRRLVEHGRCRVEANELAAVQLLRERGLRVVGGTSLNVGRWSWNSVRAACRCPSSRSPCGAACRSRIRRAASPRARST